MCSSRYSFFFFQAEDGIRDAQESRGLGDVYKRQLRGRLVVRGLAAVLLFFLLALLFLGAGLLEGDLLGLAALFFLVLLLLFFLALGHRRAAIGLVHLLLVLFVLAPV